METDPISTIRFSGFVVRGGSSRHASSTTESRVFENGRDLRPVNVELSCDTTSSEAQGVELVDLDMERKSGDYTISTVSH